MRNKVIKTGLFGLLSSVVIALSIATAQYTHAESSTDLLEDLLQEEREEQMLAKKTPAKDSRLVTMRSPSGQTERFSSKHSSYKKFKPELPKVDIDKKDYLCSDGKRLNSEQRVDLVETQLELNAVISQLKVMPEPRELTVHQRVFLAQIPFCEQFVTDLMIISKLLKGYTLVSLSASKLSK
jgi:hypothetical protein